MSVAATLPTCVPGAAQREARWAPGGALQTPISGLPEIDAQMRASRVNPTCVDRHDLCRSRISGAPLRNGFALHRIRDTRGEPE
jgi:hypothetical protein